VEKDNGNGNGNGNASTNYTVLGSDLRLLFDKRISALAAGCPIRRRLLEDYAEKIHFVKMNHISPLADAGCNTSSLANDAELNVNALCVPMVSSVTIYFSSYSFLSNGQGGGRRFLDAADNVEAFVIGIIQAEFPSLADGVPGVYNGATVNNHGDGDSLGLTRFSSGTKAAIGVGIGCSLIAVLTVAIITRKKPQFDSPQGMIGIIPDRHIRSDDSISDNPTISSGRRAMMTGWGDGSITSQYDTGSEVSSKRGSAYNLKVEDGSGGGRRASQYQIGEDASYLPASVLKDLLGNDGDRSIDPDSMGYGGDGDLSLDPDLLGSDGDDLSLGPDTFEL